MSGSKSNHSRTSSLIGEKELLLGSDKGETSILSTTVPIEAIVLSAFRPRRYFDPKAMESLVESIEKNGILQPLLVRPLEAEKYELVVGERRYLGARKAKLAEVPVAIRSISAKEALYLALLENLQREDLNAVDETEGVLQLLALELERDLEEVPPLLYRMKNYRTQKSKSALGAAVGGDRLDFDFRGNVSPNGRVDSSRGNVSPDPEFEQIKLVFASLGTNWETFIRTRLPLLNLPAGLLEAVRTGRIKYTKAQAIARVKDEEKRRELLERAIADKWSLSRIKSYIKSLLDPEPEQDSLSERLDSTYKQIKKSLKKDRQLWQDFQNRARLKEILEELDRLLGKAPDSSRAENEDSASPVP
ncbi:MAG: ParB/RepB/Spo0J family partition protein [Oscillatoria sp. SIO1A7]|nr:ParB/RepB/Spo0J family partition protein [Oscillatoria sp. SIO1A7]